ncbi:MULTISPECIES: restriction endonuclease subunit S, partial [unclassified Aeromonas]|uniref:restriction endonuclease subunit S n=1 Tax=unclassified Aeromonas TaxID=257493 RepID=UPI0022E0FAB4
EVTWKIRSWKTGMVPFRALLVYKSQEEGLYPFFVRSDTVERISTYSFDGEAVLTAGDGAIGKIFHHINGKFDFHQRVYKFSDFKYVNGRYFYHYISNNLANEVIKLSAKTTVDSLRLPMLQNFVFVLPPIEHQVTIAAFLDYETARIDQLIARQRQLIELLKEKRQAVISHAVTKGLNPNVPMKDSGVEWLGQVPEHWVVTRAKIVSEIFVPQRNKPELNDSGDGVHWATMEDMKNDEINETKKFVSKSAFDEAGSKVLKKGAVVASCVGNFGVATVLNIDVVINQQLQAYIPKAIMATYLRDLIVCSKVYFDLVGTAATLVYVNQEGFGNLPILLPPIAEQEEIEQKIDRSKAKFDRAIEKGRILVELLQERRTALISAAVTGKIDLRGWQPPKSEVAA